MSSLTPPQLKALALIAKNMAIKFYQTGENVKEACDRIGWEAAEFARANHVFRNRTWNAHWSFTGYHVDLGSGMHVARVGYLGQEKVGPDRPYDGVYYGIYLETRWAGKYQILQTVRVEFESKYPEIIKSAVREAWFF